MKNLLSTLALAAAFGSLFFYIQPVLAQGTAFSYQGQLQNNGSPASGNYDFQFSLYPNAAGIPSSSQVGITLTTANVGVTNGLFIATLNFGSNFSGASLWLQIAVRPSGESAFITLAPLQQLTATPYAITAGAVTGLVSASQITGTIAASNIGAGTVTSSNLASGAAAANLNASGQGGVPAGALVLSPSNNNTALLNAGYVLLGTTSVGDSWGQDNNGPPLGEDHTAVWTGSEMIVWGGFNGSSYFNTGGIYNPTADSWTPTSTTGAPSVRSQHTSVWTGSAMIVWGGYDGANYVNTGGIYNPAANSWTTMSTTGAPAGRDSHTAVWTGSEMIVWGGVSSSAFNTGGIYDPAANSWTTISTNPAPSARFGHTAVWTGNAMIVGGGTGGANYFNDTWSYTLKTLMYLYQWP